jgi:peptidoglycan hydrolase-like protein with peptidoglycan-binding domain
VNAFKSLVREAPQAEPVLEDHPGGNKHRRVASPKGEKVRSYLARTLAGVVAVVGIATGSLVGASASEAAAPPAAPAVNSVVPFAVNNLGLTTHEAENWQSELNEFYGAGLTVDGQLGPASWEAAQKAFKSEGWYSGAIDGIVGSGTIKGLQQYLNYYGGYNLAVDGIAGTQTKAAFAAYNNY